MERRILLNARTDETVGFVDLPEGSSPDQWETIRSGFFECYWEGTEKPVLDVVVDGE